MSASVPQNDCGTGTDAGGSHAAATTISLPKSNCSGGLTTSTDTEDWYQFYVTDPQQISVSVTPNGSSDYDICLYDPYEAQVGCSTSGGSATDLVANYEAYANGYWRAKVYIYSGTGSYTFSASTGVAQNDCGSGTDAGNTSSSALSIATPVSCQGSHPTSSDGMDWYYFYAVSGDVITASMTPASGANFDLCLNNPSLVTVVCSANGSSATDSVSYTATSSGYWYVDTYVTSGTGTYSLSISAAPPATDCGYSDAGGSHAAASSISLPADCSGTLTTSTDTEDWYKFSVTSGQTITASMTPNSGADFDICIYNPSGTLVSGCSAGTTGGTDGLTHVATATGSYRLRVLIYSGTGAYDITVSATGGGGGQPVRTDDGEKDADLPMNYTDDVAVKRVDLTSAQLSGRSSWTLHIYGMSYRCGTSGGAWYIRMNNTPIADINPCDEWSSSTFTWQTFTFPITPDVVAGQHTFSLTRHTGDWTTRAVYLGVDSDSDYGKSDTVYDGTSMNGELMWYVTLS